MESQSTLPVASSASPVVVIAGFAWVLAYLAARYVLDTWAPESPWDIAVVSIPLFAFYWFVWAVQRTLRNADELQRRIHLEALALAFLSTMLAIMGLGLLEDTPRGHIVLPLRHVWLALIPLYGICYAAARWHYR
jgi:hypothetical protein